MRITAPIRVAGPALALLLAAAPAAAQETFHACYVPDVGAVYMIKITGLPQACLGESHVEFSWSEGMAELADGAVTLAKLAFDPATQEELDDAQAALQAEGTLNEPGNPVHWSQLQGVPGGFADGQDNTGGTSSDVDCVGCVETEELGDGAVTAAKIAPGTKVPDSELLDGQEAADFASAAHDHDSQYFTKTQLQASGTVNAAGNPVHWTRLVGVPAGFADGVDGGTADNVICDRCVHGSDIAGNTITRDQIGSSAVDSTELASSAVTSSHIANGTITGVDMADNSIRAAQLSVFYVRRSSNSTVDATSSGLRSVTCPSGYEVLGGGWAATEEAFSGVLTGRVSFPDTSENPHKWTVRVSNGAPHGVDVTVYAICANIQD